MELERDVLVSPSEEVPVIEGVGGHDPRAGGAWRGQQNDCLHRGRGAQYGAALSAVAGCAGGADSACGPAIDGRRTAPGARAL